MTTAVISRMGMDFHCYDIAGAGRITLMDSLDGTTTIELVGKYSVEAKRTISLADLRAYLKQRDEGALLPAEVIS